MKLKTKVQSYNTDSYNYRQGKKSLIFLSRIVAVAVVRRQ